MKFAKLTVKIALVVAVLCFAGSTFGQGRGNGKGNGNGGGPGEETIPNNLSVPAIFVGGTQNVQYPAVYPEFIVPEQVPISEFSVAGFYYVQGIHKWQAESSSSSVVEPVYAKWGDNLIGDAKLKVGSPIRVEVGLYSTDLLRPDMTGWEVVKLEPDQLDRVSPYGTEVFDDGSSDYTTPFIPVANPNPLDEFLGMESVREVRVYDNAATWTITDANGASVLPTSLASAEINSTGRYVYGYNLRVGVPGEYTIVFNAPNTTIEGTDNVPTAEIVDTSTVKLIINVVAGGGNGGGKGGGRP